MRRLFNEPETVQEPVDPDQEDIREDPDIHDISCDVVIPDISNNGKISNFLSGRIQVVKANNAISAPSEVTSGVLQGSVLGPVFLLFINDLASNLFPGVRIKLFADDC